MPSLFVLPRQVPLSSSAGLLAGAKLTFSISGSSTLQNTYSDIALAVPNANPVIADGSGVFSKVFLDPSLPSYRVKLTTSANVLIYQEDEVPSNQNTAQTFRLKATAPELLFEETDGTSNNKKWRIHVNGQVMTIDIGDDAESLWTTLLSLTRTGTAVDSLNFAGQYLRVNGILVATQETGTVGITLTGMTSATTGTLVWRRTGTKFSLTATNQIAGTSNTTGMSMTGLGSLAPIGILGIQPVVVRDNGANTIGIAQLTSDTIVFGAGLAGGNFTNSGSKGIPAGWQFTYDTNASGVA